MAQHHHHIDRTNGELIIDACVGTIKRNAFKFCDVIKKVTFKHTVSNPVIIEASAFEQGNEKFWVRKPGFLWVEEDYYQWGVYHTGVEVLDVPPRATFKMQSFASAKALKRLVFRDDSDYSALKFEARAFRSSGLAGKEVLLCAPLICTSMPPSD